MRTLLDDSEIDWLCLHISREEVECQDISPCLGTLQQLVANREIAVRFRGRVDLAFGGYDYDPREIYEIQDIRDFCKKLDQEFPYWFFFLPTKLGMLKVLSFCLCGVKKMAAGLVMPVPSDWENYLISHGAAFRGLCAMCEINQEMQEQLTRELVNYFSK